MSLRWYYPDQVMTVYSQIESSNLSLLLKQVAGEKSRWKRTPVHAYT
jgi:hypothetical protein